MPQIPLLSGITASERADFNLSYPVNLEPASVDSGISAGYLRSAMGATSFGTGPGVDRGGTVWNGAHYRVMGTKLVSVSAAGVVTELGDVGAGGPVGLEYGFSQLAIQSGTSLYYWNGATLTQVTDPDLGQCKDIAWFNGQYFSTDGTYIVALDIADPTAVNPLKYGSAESDPDPIRGLIKLRNELYVPGADTTEVFNYSGGSGFPLTVIQGASVPIGCVGPRAKALFGQSYAFVGNGRNQAPGVWLMGSGTAAKLSTRIVDDYLAAEPNPSGIEIESRSSRDEERLYVHLTGKSLVYLRNASQATGQPVWYVAQSGLGMDSAYRLRRAVLANNKFVVGDTESSALGVLDESVATHFGEAVGWRFDTRLLYNAGKSAILHELELTGLPGRGGGNSSVFMSSTLDGETWSMERECRTPAQGNRTKRMAWFPHKRFSRYMGLRFRGSSGQLAGLAALEAVLA